MADEGLVFACQGCCCGHPETGGPKGTPRALRAAARRAFRRAGLAGRIRLVFTDCLGPCSEANVVFVYVHGRPFWFRRMNGPEVFEALMTCLRSAPEELPEALAERAFSWTGGGVGPELVPAGAVT